MCCLILSLSERSYDHYKMTALRKDEVKYARALVVVAICVPWSAFQAQVRGWTSVEVRRCMVSDSSSESN